MPKFEIWREGFVITGDSSTAQILGIEEGVNFHEACKTFFGKKRGHHNLYDAEHNTYWKCKLFDIESDARMSFG